MGDTPPVDPPAALDEAKLSELIGKVVNDTFDKRKAEITTPAPPAPPGDPATPPAPAPAGGGPSQLPADLATLVNSAVDKALRQRDDEDQLAVLTQAVDDIRKNLTPARKRSWGSFLVGGFGR